MLLRSGRNIGEANQAEGSNMHGNNYSPEPERQSPQSPNYYCPDPHYGGTNQGSGPSNAEQFQEHDQGSYPESNSPTDATDGSHQDLSPEQHHGEYGHEGYLPPMEDPNNPPDTGLSAPTPNYRSSSYVSDYGVLAPGHSYSPRVQSPYGTNVQHGHPIDEFARGPDPWHLGDGVNEENHRRQIADSLPEHPDLIGYPLDHDWHEGKLPKDLTEMEKEEHKLRKKSRNAKRKDRSPLMDKERHKKDRDRRGDGGHGFGRSTRV